MCSYFNCAAYNDVDTTIRVSDHVIFLALKVKGKDTDMHLTLNPFQIRTLAKYLSVALTQVDFKDLIGEEHFGDLSVQIELDDQKAVSSVKIFCESNMIYDDEYSAVVPF